VNQPLPLPDLGLVYCLLSFPAALAGYENPRPQPLLTNLHYRDNASWKWQLLLPGVLHSAERWIAPVPGCCWQKGGFNEFASKNKGQKAMCWLLYKYLQGLGGPWSSLMRNQLVQI
jgi:hypothetical protein